MNISENIEETGDNMNNGEIEDNEDIEDMIYGNNDYQLQYDINESRVLFDNDVVGCIDWDDEMDSMFIIWDDILTNINGKRVTIEFDDINLFSPCISTS